MNIDNDAKLYIWWDATLSFDPTGSVVTLKIDNTTYPMTWIGAPLLSGLSVWRQTARTDGLFAGSAVNPAGAVALPVGRLVAEPIVSANGQVIPCETSYIDVG